MASRISEEVRSFPVLYVIGMGVAFAAISLLKIDFFTVGLVSTFGLAMALALYSLYKRNMLPREWLLPLGLLGIALTMLFYGAIQKGYVPLVLVTGDLFSDIWSSSLIYAMIFTMGAAAGASALYIYSNRGRLRFR